jgi:hypothetical protein
MVYTLKDISKRWQLFRILDCDHLNWSLEQLNGIFQLNAKELEENPIQFYANISFENYAPGIVILNDPMGEIVWNPESFRFKKNLLIQNPNDSSKIEVLSGNDSFLILPKSNLRVNQVLHPIKPKKEDSLFLD